MGPTIALVGKLLQAKTVVFYDTEMAKITNWFTYPLADYVCTPECYQGSAGKNQVRYAGYHELTYLHPSRFRPDESVLEEAGLAAGNRFFIVRFVSWEASHDIQEKGLGCEQKMKLVKLLSDNGRVFISSEAPLPKELEQYSLRIPVSRIHHLMAYASLLVGESATMASESAVLGIPAVFISKTSRGYIDDQQKRYDLVHYFTDKQQEEAMAYIQKLIEDKDLRANSAEAHKRLLAQHVDVTSWMINFFEKKA
jgi:predicted glycosyltransferase